MTWPFPHFPPYKVQEEALARAAERPRFAYFMEMGLGKTATVLAEFVLLMAQHKVDALIVVCPNSLKGVWLDEMEKVGMKGHHAPWPKPLIHVAGGVQIINYEAVITVKGYNAIQKLIAEQRCMIVLDESTQIKNHAAKRTKLLIGLCKQATFVRLLSGQPVVQGPQDLWSQLRCLGVLSGMNFYAYRGAHCIMGGFMNRQILGARHPEQLNAILNGVSFRATKEQWLDLPKQIYTTREIELTAVQQKHYKEMKQFLITLIQGHEVDANLVITQMLKLQQITSGFMIDGEHHVHDLPGANPKIDEVLDIMEQVNGKVLIATWFRHSSTKLLSALYQYSPVVIMGDMESADVEESKTRFAEDSKTRVMVCQIQSTKYGLTLLGGDGSDRCATTVFFENGFSLDARIQFESRNHRIGQDHPVVYIDLVASPMDKIVIQALKNKQDVASAIIDSVRHAR